MAAEEIFAAVGPKSEVKFVLRFLFGSLLGVWPMRAGISITVQHAIKPFVWTADPDISPLSEAGYKR